MVPPSVGAKITSLGASAGSVGGTGVGVLGATVNEKGVNGTVAAAAAASVTVALTACVEGDESFRPTARTPPQQRIVTSTAPATMRYCTLRLIILRCCGCGGCCDG